jgi:hypothetical protein
MRLTPLVSSRSPSQLAVVTTLDRFGLATASQLRRLHYEGTPDGVRVRSSRHFRSLVKRGLIRRLPYRVTANAYGAAEYAYTPASSTMEVLRPHMFDVTELYVELAEVVGVDSVEYAPEEWGSGVWGGVALHPDAYVRLPTLRRQYFVEVDRSSERPSVIAAKMNKYVRALQGMDGGYFPHVLWTARTAGRKRELERIAKQRAVPELFIIELFDNAVRLMAND